jgi:hypothetical protein
MLYRTLLAMLLAFAALTPFSAQVTGGPEHEPIPDCFPCPTKK